MKIIKKTILCGGLILTLLVFGACKPKQQAAQGPKGSLEVLTPAVGIVSTILADINSSFAAAYPDIHVEYASLGGDYENTMKIKMASNQLPDVYGTHGWAKLRYAEYLMDLQDQPWAKNIDPSIRSLVTIGDKVLTLPIDSFRSGFVYSVKVLQDYGIDVPTTMDQMEKAFETIKQKSGGTVTGLYIGGSDNWMYGAYINTFATPLTVTAPTNDGQALKSGTYDWSKFMPIPTKLLEYYSKGYINKDCLTSTFADAVKALAENKYAFTMIGPDVIPSAQAINPDFKGGIMPIPSVYGDAPAFQGGEMNSWGVWKDTKNPDAAKLYLQFAARPENVTKICQATSSPAGITTVKPDLGELAQYWDKYASNPVVPMWDREFMPNGMWDSMSVAGQELMSGSLNAQGFVDRMHSEYLRLRAAATAK